MKLQNNFITLIKNQLFLLVEKKRVIFFVISLFLINLIVSIIGLFIIQMNSAEIEKLTKINILIMVNSIPFLLLSLFTTITLFLVHLKNNLHSIELRFGYNLKQIFFSRIISNFIINLAFYLLSFLTSLIFFGIVNQDQNLLIYRMYISAFGWYAILILVSITLSMLLAVFFKELTTSICASLFMVLFLLIPAIIGLVQISKAENKDLNPYQIILKENYNKQVYTELVKLEDGKELLKDVNNIVTNKGIENFINGSWLLGTQNNENYFIYKKYLAEFMEALDSNKINSQIQWNDIQVFSNTTFLIKEDLTSVFKQINESSISNNADYLLKVMKTNTQNWVFLKEVEIIKNYNLDEDAKGLIQAKYNPEQYLFLTTFNNLLASANEYQNQWLTKKNSKNLGISIDLGPEVLNRINSNNLLNWLNPLHHINIMFHSIDYNNYYLYNLVSTKQFINTGIPNISFSSKDNTFNNHLENEQTISMSVRPEILYITYSLVFFLIIALIYSRFKKIAKA